jgi:DNA-binding PadR family transcriptional regulator
MNPEQILKLDPVVHAPIRLAILSILITIKDANFSYLKEAIGTSDGNLSTHLTKLETSGYVSIEKKFVGKKPQTICSITESGRAALSKHLEQLENIVAMQKDKE